MKKIQKTIDNCQDCEFSLIYEHKGSQALICGGVQFDEDRTREFLILIADNVKHYKSEIPNNCPLENYEPKTDCR
ncbi:hypothetical protein [Flavobacterium branchiophilum]|uniref:Uncharacterized protein n=1 Tax=Flavobacterium branchiophilum TaxID=55197 RepID=A0A2H3KBX5_9FLAO|nr:hypothetical protein [Flavobacterium branchiophilum]PDS24667.1 hypothetical protein B0A77_07310 [Flavobacterium branchiophilum]